MRNANEGEKVVCPGCEMTLVPTKVWKGAGKKMYGLLPAHKGMVPYSQEDCAWTGLVAPLKEEGK